MHRLFLFLIIGILASVHVSKSATLAFPGAEGHGRYVTGGRGGTVYIVNSLEDNVSNPVAGTMRYAVDKSGARTIVFAVSGTIHLKAELKISYDNITIAGQTAPGDGICLADFPVSVNANNVIMRFIRCRMGDLAVTNSDGADAMGGRGKSNIIIDHCSMSWSSDECVSFYGNTNFTLQWCIISESLRLSGHTKGPHGYGGIWGGVNASFHHNLLAHHDSRNPRLGPFESTMGKEVVDLRNNVIYNWCGNSCYGGEGMNANIVNCYYKPGPATPTGSKRGRIISIDMSSSAGAANYNKWGKFYIAGNVINDGTNNASCTNATNDNWTYGVYNQFASGYTITQTLKDTIKVTTPFNPGDVSTHTAQKAYEKVLDYSGCSYSRDSLDIRIINETRTGTAAFKGLSKYNGYSTNYPGSTTDWKSTNYPKQGIIDSQQDLMHAGADSATWSAWPALQSETAPVDNDMDGMPDEWETSHGLSSINASDRNLYTLDAAFTNLEVYINSLVSAITENQVQDAVLSFNNPNIGSRKAYLAQNPVNETLVLKCDRQMNTLHIYDLNGLTLQSHSHLGTSASLPVDCLQSGIYLVDVQFENGDKQALKFIKN